MEELGAKVYLVVPSTVLVTLAVASLTAALVVLSAGFSQEISARERAQSGMVWMIFMVCREFFGGFAFFAMG